jgi:hypothetical protein
LVEAWGKCDFISALNMREDKLIDRITSLIEDERKAERERIRNRIKRLTNYTIEGRLFVLLDELLVITTTEEKQNLTLGPSK